MWTNNLDFKKIKLSSGATLLNVSIPDIPIAIVSAWFRAGSRFDPFGKEGLSHFFEHLFMTKTKTFPNREHRLKKLEGGGITFNAFTAHETVHYYYSLTSLNIKDGIQLLADGLNHSCINQADLEQEKGVIIDEERRSRTDPAEFIWRLSQQNIWPGSMLGRDLFGTEQSIKSISLEDIESFQKQFYNPDNLLFLIISNEQTSCVQSLIEKFYTPSLAQTIFPNESPFANPKTVIVENRDAEQVTVALNFKTTSIKNTDEINLLHFIKNYLANNWISRLVNRLRIESDITYWVDGEAENFSDTGFLRLTFTARPEKVNRALALIAEEIKSLKEESIPAQELDIYKTSYSSSIIRRHLDPHALLYWYGEPAVLGGKISNINNYLDYIQTITPENVQRISRRYLVRENLCAVFLGPIHENDVLLHI